MIKLSSMNNHTKINLSQPVNYDSRKQETFSRNRASFKAYRHGSKKQMNFCAEGQIRNTRPLLFPPDPGHKFQGQLCRSIDLKTRVHQPWSMIASLPMKAKSQCLPFKKTASKGVKPLLTTLSQTYTATKNVTHIEQSKATRLSKKSKVASFAHFRGVICTLYRAQESPSRKVRLARRSGMCR